MDVLTVKVLQMDTQPVGLLKALPTFSADVRFVSCVRADVTGQFDGLCERGRAILTAVHFTCE